MLKKKTDLHSVEHDPSSLWVNDMYFLVFFIDVYLCMQFNYIIKIHLNVIVGSIE